MLLFSLRLCVCVVVFIHEKENWLWKSRNITIADNLPKFAYAGQLPIQVPLSYMYFDEEKGIKEMLRSHKASWHKSSCHLAQMQHCKADQCSKEEAYSCQSVFWRGYFHTIKSNQNKTCLTWNSSQIFDLWWHKATLVLRARR